MNALEIYRERQYVPLRFSFDRRVAYATEAFVAVSSLTSAKDRSMICYRATEERLLSQVFGKFAPITVVEPRKELRQSLIVADVPGLKWHFDRLETLGPEARAAFFLCGNSLEGFSRTEFLCRSAQHLLPDGWLACLWQQRDLSDPMQWALESLVHAMVPGYSHGAPLPSVEEAIRVSGLFDRVETREFRVEHEVSLDDYLRAWQENTLLYQRAGEVWPAVLRALRGELKGRTKLSVPYKMYLCTAKKK